jgi:hypothetical protein
MTRKWSVRLLALGGLTVALGCRSTPAPVVTTPLLPETVIPGPPADVISSKPKSIPMTAAAPSSKTLILPPGAQLPKPGDLGPTNVASLPKPIPLGPNVGGPDLPAAVVPPRDVAPILASQSKPIEPVNTISMPAPNGLTIKPLLVEPPRPPAGPDGFAPAPIIPPVFEDTYPSPKIVNKPPEPALPMKPGQKFGHAADYKWIAGVLDRHTKGGYWTLRFADFGSDDEWGGKMRLLDDPRLNNFKDGDVLFIGGELLAPRAAASADGTSYPPYRINDVRLVENVK